MWLVYLDARYAELNMPELYKLPIYACHKKLFHFWSKFNTFLKSFDKKLKVFCLHNR